MITAIISHLEADAELTTILGSEDSPKIFPLGHANTDDDPYIVYSYSPVGGRYVMENRLELRIVSKSLAKIQDIEKIIMRLMNWKRQSGITINSKIIYNTSLNGGGLLKNPDTGMIERILFFNVKTN